MTALVNPTKQDVFIGIGLAVPIDVAGGAAGLPAVLIPTRTLKEVTPMDHELERPTPAAPMERLLYEVKKVIVGQDHLLERMVVALLARGHLLVEGVPGLAKTMAIKTLAQSIGGEFKRIQFTPGPRARPTSSARGSTTRRPASSRRRSGPSSRTCSSPTRSTARRPRSRARCSR